HISLGIWFRDYVYIPLGGNRCSKSRWFFNIFAVWFLTGLWHGASFNFILWGLFFGVILLLEKLFLLDILKKVPSFISHFYVIFLVIISFVLFDITKLSDVFKYLGVMFDFSRSLFDAEFLYYLIPNVVLLIVSILASTPLFKNYLDKYKYLRLIVLIFGLVLSTALLVDATFNPFL
ncbi:MAG: MBOAT family O-acyltransferase, partial [Erysipelotrichaceae bacterium]